MVTLSTSFLDELRARTSVSEVIKRKVALKAKGKNEYLGLCPFHKENTPSFTVSDDKGFYHCFGCGAHGDAIKFLTETEGLPFMEAVKQLASEAGMEIPQSSMRSEKEEQQRASQYEIMEAACSWFQNQLTQDIGKTAREYLHKRGISNEIVALFRLGFSPNDRHGLSQYIKQKLNISQSELIKAGLVVETKNGDLIDRFRGRLIFPIMDAKNRVIAFGGRILGDGQPKYLNSPDTPLFNKGYVLYNEQLAKALAYKTGKLVLAEGYMDVIALYQAGIKTAVAPLGTALTEHQIQRLWRLSKEPVICLDGDTAGKRAMMRATHTALPHVKPGYTLRFTTLEEGFDPDDYIKRYGVEAMREQLRESKPMAELIWQDAWQAKPIDTPEQKAELEKRLLDLCKSIQDDTVKDYYSRYFKDQLWTHIKRSQAKVMPKAKRQSKNTLTPPKTLIKTEALFPIDPSSPTGCTTHLVALLIAAPELLEDVSIEEEVMRIDFSSNTLDKMVQIVIEMASLNEAPLGSAVLNKTLEQRGYKAELAFLNSLDPLSSRKDPELAWRYMHRFYVLSTMREEVAMLHKELSEEAEQKAYDLQEQIILMEKDIRNMQNLFEE